MSTVSPWGLGINRAEIESLVIELTMIATGLPANRVLIVDQGASTPDPPRPFVGIFVSSPVVPMKTGGDIRLFPAYEAWTVTVTDASDGVYSISIQGTPYAFTATSNTIEETRDGLLAAFGTPSAFTATAQGVDSIDILSTVKGARLLPETSPLTLLLVNTRGPADQWKFEPAELQVNISCNALPSLEAPSCSPKRPDDGRPGPYHVRLATDDREDARLRPRPRAHLHPGFSGAVGARDAVTGDRPDRPEDHDAIPDQSTDRGRDPHGPACAAVR